MTWRLHQGDSLQVLQTLPDESFHCCVTSPPYWGLRDYGVEGQLGVETSPDDYVRNLVAVFRQVRRVLRSDGTLWLNLGDTYATGVGSAMTPGGQAFGKANAVIDAGAFPRCQPNRMPIPGLKPKDLVGAPWRVAFALQADGWFLRSEIIWHKPNPMPESVRDRPTKSHEQIFLLSKSERYHYDSESIKEPAVCADEARWAGTDNGLESSKSWVGTGKSTRRFGRAGATAFRGQGHFRDGDGPANRPGRDLNEVGAGITRNKRSVWSVATRPFKGAHFATFPPKLIEPCILAGSPRGGTVLDPFAGACTTGVVALRHGRDFVGIELNPQYIEIATKRIQSELGLFAKEGGVA
jgi:DNA modification methylase